MQRIFLILILLNFSKCTLNRECLSTETIIGKYVNNIEPESTHYVEIKSSGEFYHFYQKGNLIQENKGSWSFSKKSCEISFSIWKSFGEYKDKNCINGCSANVKIK